MLSTSGIDVMCQADLSRLAGKGLFHSTPALLTTRRAHSAKAHGQEFDVCDRHMGTLARAGWGDPESAGFAAPCACLDRTAKNQNVLVSRWVCTGITVPR